MSNPLSGTSPLTATYSATVAQDGSAIISQIVRQAYWSGFYVTCQSTNGSSGVCQWAGAVNQAIQTFGQGADVVMGPFYLAPGAQVQVQVLNAQPGAGVVVNLWGIQASTPADIFAISGAVTANSLSLTGPVDISGTIPVEGTVAVSEVSGNVPVVNAPNTTLSTLQEEVQLGSFAVAAGATNSGTYTVDVGARIVSVIVTNFIDCSLVTVTGAVTGNVYLEQVPTAVGVGFYACTVSTSWDTSVYVSATYTSAGGGTVYASQVFDTTEMIVTPLGGIMPSNLLGPQWTPTASTFVDYTGTSVELTPAAGAGEDTYLHWFTLAGGTAAITIEIVGATSGHILAGWYPPAANAIMVSKDFKGLKLGNVYGMTAGEELLLKTSSSQYIYATLDYAQG